MQLLEIESVIFRFLVDLVFLDEKWLILILVIFVIVEVLQG